MPRRRRRGRILALFLISGGMLFNQGCAQALSMLMPLLTKAGGFLGPVQQLLPVLGAIPGSPLAGLGGGPAKILGLATSTISTAQRLGALVDPPREARGESLPRADTSRALDAVASAPLVPPRARALASGVRTATGLASSVSRIRLP